MTRHLFVVLSNAAEGRDDEFNDWYSNEHSADVLKVPGVAWVQRFANANHAQTSESHHGQYLALYGLDHDPSAVLNAIRVEVSTGRMSVPEVVTDVEAWVFTAREGSHLRFHGSSTTIFLIFAAETQDTVAMDDHAAWSQDLETIPTVKSAENLRYAEATYDPNVPSPYTHLTVLELDAEDGVLLEDIRARGAERGVEIIALSFAPITPAMASTDR